MGLKSARFELSIGNKLSDTLLVWSTFGCFDRMEHTWGWVYQFDPPVPTEFLQRGSTELFQEPQRYTRLALPRDGNPNPVAKGLPRRLKPPLPPSRESTLPFSALPPPPERTGRAKLTLDSAGVFLMDRLMATVAQYDSCVTAGKCTAVWSDSLANTNPDRVWKACAKWPESVQSGPNLAQAWAYCQWREPSSPSRRSGARCCEEPWSD